MSEQFSLFDAPPPSPPPLGKPKPAAKGEDAPFSLFLSLIPVPEDAARFAGVAAALRQAHGLTGRPLLPNRLHVPLHDLGKHAELPTEIVSSVRQAADALTFPAFDVVFDHALSFPSSGTYVLGGGAGCEALTAFQKSLGAALKDREVRFKSGFTPHMTLLYDRHPVAQHPIEPLC